MSSLTPPSTPLDAKPLRYTLVSSNSAPPALATMVAQVSSTQTSPIATVGNAQELFPTSACVFVANLPSSLSDVELHDAVRSTFVTYGQCYVRVKRASNMPHAFVQFTSDASARAAISSASGTMIGGRPCRVEPSAVSTTLIVRANDGRALSYQEVHSAFQQYDQQCRVVSDPSFSGAWRVTVNYHGMSIRAQRELPRKHDWVVTKRLLDSQTPNNFICFPHPPRSAMDYIRRDILIWDLPAHMPFLQVQQYISNLVGAQFLDTANVVQYYRHGSGQICKCVRATVCHPVDMDCLIHYLKHRGPILSVDGYQVRVDRVADVRHDGLNTTLIRDPFPYFQTTPTLEHCSRYPTYFRMPNGQLVADW